MRKLLLALVATTSLGACTTGAGIGVTPTTLQNALVAGCGIVISSASLLQLISAANSTLTSIDAIVTAVCQAHAVASAPVTTPKGRLVFRQTAPIAVTIGGIVVPITGAKPI
jgi:hypothetical protein